MTLIEILKSCNLTHPFQLIGKILVVSLDKNTFPIQCSSAQLEPAARHQVTIHFHPIRLDDTILSDRIVYDPQSNEWIILGTSMDDGGPFGKKIQIETLESYLQNADDFTK